MKQLIFQKKESQKLKQHADELKQQAMAAGVTRNQLDDTLEN